MLDNWTYNKIGTSAVGLLAEKKKKGGDWARVEEYDVALIAFGLTTFYAEFNEVRHGVFVIFVELIMLEYFFKAKIICSQACRNLKTVSEASSFKYRNFYNLLLRGIKNCKGDPLRISRTDKLYRGCSIKPADLPIKENERFLFKQFTSTSLNIATAASFSSGGSLFVIDGINQGALGNQNVIGLGKHSTFAYEQEVILSPFEVYTITKIEKEAGKQYTTVHLRATD
ncbi:hypothetical protein HA402_008024 [Bradysia odoriphaga]|nr:hypothetical protein HA402_008024 [Bradysia odoriphaga]